MKQQNALYVCALAVCSVSAGEAFDHPLLAQKTDPIVMVVNKGNPADALSKGDAKKLLLGQTVNWPSGATVTVVMRPQQSADRVSVLQKLSGMTEAEYTRYEMQVMFTGRTAVAVQSEPSAAAIKSYVKSNPGAVGFLRESEVDGEVKQVLKVE
jgi:ABC-type phosphate transport system substrate-binding protein